MRNMPVLIVMFVMVLAAGSSMAAPAVFVASSENGGTFRTLDGNDLTNELYSQTSTDFAGVTVVTVAEVDATSDGAELIIGRGDVLEIRSSQTYALLKSSAGHDRPGLLLPAWRIPQFRRRPLPDRPGASDEVGRTQPSLSAPPRCHSRRCRG